MKVVWLTLVFILIFIITSGTYASETYIAGVWNNFDFSRSAEYWADSTRSFGGEDGVLDLVVAQANSNGFIYLPFPITSNNYLRPDSAVDDAEPYLDVFDANGLKVILSIQPLKANITQLIEILLSRYGHHQNILGVNIDLEWKESGTPNHVNNEERDLYLNILREFKSDYKLFLTYFKNYTHFPKDDEGLVVLYDGQSDTQQNLLKQYRELAEHYEVIGIYTGYSSSIPPTASQDSILVAVPDTAYILHTDDIPTDEGVILNWILCLTIGLVVILILGFYLTFNKQRPSFQIVR